MRKIKIKNLTQLISKILRWHFNYYILKKPSPLNVGFYITSKCNLKCEMCNLWRNPKKITFDFNLFKNVVDDISKKGCYYLSFGGGEPLLADNIFEMIAYAKKKIPFVHIVTNGQTINEKITKKLSELELDEISLSIDGLEKTHDKIRGVKGSFKRTIKAIENLKKYAPNIDIVINTVILSKNIEDLPKLTELIRSMGLKHQFQPRNKPPKIEGQISKAEENYRLNEEQIKKVEEFIKANIKQKNIINSKYFLENILSYFKDDLKGVFIKECINPYFFCEHRENNELYPCLLAYNWKKGFKIKKDFKEIFYSKEYKNAIKKLKKDCKLCQKNMFVCYSELRIMFPITRFLRYDLPCTIKYIFKK